MNKQMQKIAGLVLTVLVVGGLAWGIRAYQQKPAETSGSGAAPSTQAQDGLVLIPQGTFTMGSPDSERQREKDETAHEVSVSAFYLSPTEVTQEQYQQVMGENPSHFQGQQLPVENVTWYQAVEFCNKLSSQKGLTPAYQVNGNTVTWDRSADGYRLSTEAEWEYAARAGTHSIYYFGNQINSDQANFEGDYPYLIEENYVVQRDPKVVPSANRGKTIPVDQLPANAFGLHNMLGNVSEWVFDYYGPYGTSPQKDPAGAEKGSLRVNRGGGYNDFGKHLRAAYRSATNPLDHDQNLGFRICRNAQPGKGLVKTTASLQPAMPAQPRVLIAYFSYSGNTRKAAQLLQEKTGADLYAITMAQPYTGDIYEASKKDLMQNVHPALAGAMPDLSRYDVILLGYPTWWATMPMPVFTFLESGDFSGKLLFSFSSHGGNRFGDSVSDLAKEIPQTYVGRPFEFHYSGGSSLSQELSAWLAQCGLKEK